MVNKRKVFLNSIILMTLVFSRAFLLHAGNTEPYKVGIGDTISISVLGHEELTETARVIRDGTIPFYFVGTIPVEGLTLKSIKSRLYESLAPQYLNKPEIVVRLVEKKKERFFVYGEVKNPGMYSIDGDITVLKAISIAGGYGRFADVKKVKIMRVSKEKSEVNDIIVNLDKIVKESNPKLDLSIQAEDIVIVLRR